MGAIPVRKNACVQFLASPWPTAAFDRTKKCAEGCSPPAAFSHVHDRSSAHLSVNDVHSLLPGCTPCHTEVGECMRLVQPENTACGGGCYCARATDPYRNVIPLGITGMSVKAVECAG